MTIYAMRAASPEYLNEVVEKMQTLGTPEIKAVFDGEAYWSLKGSHRIAAAEKLGLIPRIVEVSLEDEVLNEDIETDKLTPGKTYTAKEICDEVYSSAIFTRQYIF